MKVKTEDVLKALDSLQEGFEEEVVKASEQDLDQPEGADLGNPVKEKMSDEAKSMKKVKKAEEMEEEEGEEDEEEGEDMEMEKKMKAKKSFAGDLPEEVQTKIEVSEFLKSLVDHNVDGLKKLADYVAKSDAAQETRYSELNEVVEGLAKSQAKIGVVLKAICEKLNIIENSPATAPKSEIVAKSQTNAERTFSSGLETEKGEEPVFKSLSNDPIMAKSQISNALCDLVMKGEATDMDVINFESAGFISPELVNKLKGKL